MYLIFSGTFLRYILNYSVHLVCTHVSVVAPLPSDYLQVYMHTL